MQHFYVSKRAGKTGDAYYASFQANENLEIFQRMMMHVVIQNSKGSGNLIGGLEETATITLL